ncbi:glucosaminidase domain-containing protein [Candidatus Berkiella cookevillensis]|uniref:Glucosaminidase domain-containing protein n=1 Tax=Candidatus Berkiella cookevillensis TaxID=437022 RepID=A0A0Q9YBS1_9GAMM|nr:glucosaminidase domain-containing protein [Candidatus Berkiella cookevillensis]MCS5709157.1 glucosaminidase domain-containing protein [Candidatus Berkiella cookevillensis]
MISQIKNNFIYPMLLTLCLIVPTASMAADQPTEKTKFNSAADFAQTIYPHAKEAAKELGIDPKVLVAQAAHETNWGKKIPKCRDGSSSYNIFGVKSSQGTSQKKVITNTKEYRRGKLVKEVAGFRAYDGFQESFSDYVAMLKRCARYQAALEAESPYDFLINLQKSGYATDPSYAKKIFSVYQSKTLKCLV